MRPLAARGICDSSIIEMVIITIIIVNMARPFEVRCAAKVRSSGWLTGERAGLMRRQVGYCERARAKPPLSHGGGGGKRAPMHVWPAAFRRRVRYARAGPSSLPAAGS